MFKKLFGKKEEESRQPVSKELVLYAPAAGKAIPLEQVPDPVFAEKMMGDGTAIEPSEGMLYAPADGRIEQVFPTGHAVGIKTENGAEILLHIGLETVGMKGEGFEALVKTGDQVKKGQKLIAFDLGLIEEKAKSTVIPMILTNMEAAETVTRSQESGTVSAGETEIMRVVMK